MKTLLLVIDFINDIVHPDGKIAQSEQLAMTEPLLANINNTIGFVREQEGLIAHVKVGFNSDYQDCPMQSPIFGKAQDYGILDLNSWGCEFYEGIDKQASDLVIRKSRISAFYSTPLEATLRANQINTVIISGVSTNMAVEMTARELHDRDYRVIVVEDACLAKTPEIHAASLANLSRLGTVCQVQDLSSMFCSK